VIGLAPSKVAVTAPLTVSGTTITRTDGRSWIDAGFTNGTTISLRGTTSSDNKKTDDGTYVITSIVGSVINLTTSVTDTTAESGTAAVAYSPSGHNAGQDTHSLIKVGDLPIGLQSGTGVLRDGSTYQVVNVDTTNHTFQLKDLSGNLLTLSNKVNDALQGLGLAARVDATTTLTGTSALSPTIHLTSASGPQDLVYNLTSGLQAGHTYQLTGPGGESLSASAVGVGDGVSSAHATGSGGGAIASQTNRANVTSNPVVYAYVLSALVTAGQDVTITSLSALRTSATASNSTGGVVGVGHAETSSTMYSDAESFVGNGTAAPRIAAGRDFILTATNANQLYGSGHSRAAGGIGVANADDTTVQITYDTKATIGSNSDILAGRNAKVAATSATEATANAYASGLGFGADGHAAANAFIGQNGDALTQAQVSTGASLFAVTASVSGTVGDVCVGGTTSACTGGYTVKGLQAHSDAQAYGAGFYSEGIAHADTEVDATNNVILNGGGSAVTGLEGVDFIARFDDVATYADGFSRSTGLFGYVNGSATNNTDLTTKVQGDSGALVTAGPRDPSGVLAQPAGATRLAFYVSTDNGSLSAGENGHTSKRSLAAGGGHDNGDAQDRAQEHKSIPFFSDVTILSGRSPLVVIDAGGNVQLLIQAIVYDSGGTVVPQGSNVGTGTIVIGDIANPGPGNVIFRAGDASASAYKITGSGGTWTFQDGLPKVAITNNSNKNIQINDIRVLTNAPPTVDLGSAVPSSPVANFNYGPSPDISGFSFTIRQAVSPTLVEIENNGTGIVTVNGTIENPIGTTVIRNQGGPVQAGGGRGVLDSVIFTAASRPSSCGGADGAAGTGHYSIICTNILDLETFGVAQDIGQNGPRINVDYVQSDSVPVATTFTTGRVSSLTHSIFLGPNQFFTGEQVKYTTTGTPIAGLTSGNYYFVAESADGLSISLSTTPNGAAIAVLTNSAHWTDGHSLLPVQRFTVNGTGSAYLDIRGIQRTNSATPPDFTVHIDHVTTLATTDLLLQTSMRQSGNGVSGGIDVIYPGHGAPGQAHYTFFNTPDTDCTTAPTPAACILDVGAFGTGSTKIDSTYDFRAPDSSGTPDLPALIAGANIIVKYQDVRDNLAFTANTIYILGITELRGTGTDLNGTGHIDILTNGWIGKPAGTSTQAIPFVEYTNDFRVGQINSERCRALIAAGDSRCRELDQVRHHAQHLRPEHHARRGQQRNRQRPEQDLRRRRRGHAR
jgi:hypothetical protein